MCRSKCGFTWRRLFEFDIRETLFLNSNFLGFKLLSQYHRKFLRLLRSKDVDFLIIGGQAKFMHFATPTRDLDIWAPVGGANSDKLENALKCWITDHPQHNDSIAYASGPLNLRRNMQIHIPMCDAWFIGDGGESLEIKSSDGIDILTSISDMNFDECFARAGQWDAAICGARYFSVDDLEASQAIRVRRDLDLST
jgi:hypothetical protein